MEITYLTSITYEKDPEKRKEILRSYKEEVRKDFEQNPAPVDEESEELSTPSS
jgi:ribosomal protein S17E